MKRFLIKVMNLIVSPKTWTFVKWFLLQLAVVVFATWVLWYFIWL